MTKNEIRWHSNGSVFNNFLFVQVLYGYDKLGSWADEQDYFIYSVRTYDLEDFVNAMSNIKFFYYKPYYTRRNT